jgi:hypothetical protein
VQWNRFVFITVLTLLLVSTFALGDSTIATNPIKNQITSAEQAAYSLKITNHENKVQRYSLYSLQSGQGWNVDPSPLKDKIIELGPGQSHTTTILANALDEFPPGIYYVQVTIQSDLGETYQRSLKIYLKSNEPSDYLPAIKVTADMDEKIDPNKALSIKLFLENRNPLDLTGLKVRMQSDMPEFLKEIEVDLPPLEKKTVEFTVVPNRFQQPKNYLLFFIFERDGETVKILEQKIEIISVLPEFDVTTYEEKIFLKSFKTLTVKNDGNVLNTQVVRIPVSFLEGLFTTSEGKVKSEEDGRFLTWEVTLSPDEFTNLSLVTNYRLLLYILIAVLIFMAFYFYVQSPLSVKKTAVTTKSGDSGALSEIKITLELTNHSKKPVKEVTVKDLVPGIANVEKGLELGTLKPTEIKHTAKGTKVFWSLAELDSHEHRIITYKMKAKLNILGTFSLPRATVEFKKRKGKSKKSYSNIFRLSS